MTGIRKTFSEKKKTSYLDEKVENINKELE
jgi:hypothetical protein